MRAILIMIITLLAGSLVSCFEPSGSSFTKIKQPDFSNVKIDLSTAGDTIYVDAPLQLTFTGDTENHPIQSIDLQLDGVDLPEEYNDFSINPSAYSVGFHPLKLTVTVSTADGSLADRFNAAITTFTRNYVVNIASPPSPVNITSFDSTGGTLTIRWERYSRPDFKSYVVHKYCSDGEYCDEATINEADQNFWNDVNYVGGKTQYYITVMASIELTGGLRTYNWIPKKTGFSIKGDQAILYWSPLLFYNNVKNVSVYGGATQPASDTTYTTAPVPVGQLDEDKITLVSAKPEQNYTFNIENYRGNYYFNQAAPYLFNSKENVYYGYTGFNNYTEVLNAALKPVTSVSQQTLAMSPDGSHLITSYAATISETDPVTLKTSNSFEMQGSPVRFPVVSNNGIIVFRSSAGSFGLRLPDYQIVYRSHRNLSNGIAISPDGNYLTDNDSVYQFNGTSFQPHMKISNNDFVAFTDNNTLVTMSIQGLFNRINVPSKTIAASNTLTNISPYYMEFDPVSKRVLMWYNAGDVLVDPETASITAHLFNTAHIANGILFFYTSDSSSFLSMPYTDVE